MALSPKTGSFRISKELHFRGCNHGKQHVSLPHGKGRRALLQGEECWEGSSRQNPRLFLFYCPVTKSCPTLCYPMDSRMPGFPVLHSLPEFAQIHVSDAIQPSVVPFSSCLQSFPASGSFPVSWLFASGGQGIEASASASVIRVDIQDGSLPGKKRYFFFLSFCSCHRT